MCLMFFFFFKQKTAYEMRISDWSSDVCSSDLLAQFLQHRDHLVDILAIGNAGIDHGVGEATRHVLHPGDQIGRASCRERVCQLRVDLGGRRIIKKKKTSDIKKDNKKRQLNTHSYDPKHNTYTQPITKN